MKLYSTKTSPYGRLIRIIVLEKGLSDRVENIWTETRKPDLPLYEFNPSGRVPYIRLDEGTGIENTPAITDYLDQLVSPLRFTQSANRNDWTYRSWEATANAMLDGVSVWVREIRRPKNERSPSLIAHEKSRAERLARFFDSRISDHRFDGPLNLLQLYLYIALELEHRISDLDWRTGNTNLVDWHARIDTLDNVRRSLVSD
ncbi:MAG: hypothetical protein CMM47_02380 [Rhodospirillaceae bacterium]|nr:hypothetical protein [Rhodospirillaceae bacterium]